MKDYDWSEKDELYEQISKNIKFYRLKTGLTQAILAERIGVSHEFMRRIESKKGQKTFSVETIYKIATVLNIDIGKLFECNEKNET